MAKEIADYRPYIVESIYGFSSEANEMDRANQVYHDGKTLTSVTREDMQTTLTFKSNQWFGGESTSGPYKESESQARGRLTEIYTEEVEVYERKNTSKTLVLEGGVMLGACALIDIAAVNWFIPEAVLPTLALSAASLGVAALYRASKWRDYQKKKLILEKDTLINDAYLEMVAGSDDYTATKDYVDVFMEPQKLSYRDVRGRQKVMSNNYRKLNIEKID